MKRFLAFTLCLAALLLASCKKEPYLTLSGPASVELSADGGSGTISFTGNNDWTASSSDSWVTVSPSSGTASDGPVTVTVKAAANTTYEDRSATVTIRSEGLTQSVTVRQSANLGVVVPTKSYQIASDARTIDVEVQANVDYSVSVSDSWIKQAGTKGLTSKTLSFAVEANGTYDARSATITNKPQSGEAQAISVTQAQKDALLVSKASYSMPYGGGEVEVKVESNVEFEVKSGADWIQYVETKGLSASTVRLKVSENKTYKAREGKVTLTQKGGSLTKTVTVKQAGRVAVTGVSLNKGSLSLEVGETATLKATVKPDNATDKSVTWSSSNKKVATVDKSGKVTAVAEGTAKITAKAGDKTATCTVTVENKVLKVGDPTVIPAEGGTFEVDIQYNTEYTVEVEKSAQSWITYVQTKALSSGKLQFSFAANESTSSRTGKVTIKDKSGKADPVTITFKQEDNKVLFEQERSALIALYKATGGSKWKNKSNWCSDNPVSEWYGISTDGAGRVVEIDLNQNNLAGKIPADLFSLSKLTKINLEYNNLTGEIPNEVGNATELTELHLQHNGLSGALPKSLYSMKKLSVIELWSNQLSDELSEKFWDMPELTQLALDDNKITGSLTPAVKKAIKMQWLGLGSNLLKGSIPEEIAELKDLRYFSLENHPISNGAITETANEISGPIPSNLDKLQKLELFLVENNNLEGNIPVCFAKMPKLTALELYGNRLSGVIPSAVVSCANWDVWAPDANIMPQQNGYTLSFEYYVSKDFSSDGKVAKLQTHEKGNGISIVITGDCFTDKDIASGLFKKVAQQTMEDFFGIEPFTTFRNLFDVYAVTAVSKTSYSNYGTALDAEFGSGSYVYCNEDKVKQYTLKAVKKLDETLTIVIVNKNKNSGTAFMPYPSLDTDYGSGFSYACFGLQDDGVTRRLLINHEANGHGFTKLQDEYYYTGSGTFPKEDGQAIKDTYFAKGFYANIDFESDPQKVKWAKFLSDKRYKYDGLGVFEGGMTMEKGVWRPSENSIMGYQQVGYDGDRFNAPSRAAAYIRIHKLAYGSSWKFDYEEFVKYDAKNRKTSASTQSARVPEAGSRPVIPHTPPVFIGSKK